MALTVQTVTILGAGTMGSALAGLLGDAGLRVLLLDLPSGTVKAGRSPDPRQRNQIARAGLERMQASRPPNLYVEGCLDSIETGNTEDDFEASISRSEWILEAISEDLELKRELWRRIQACCPAKSFVSTNTSGLPLRLLTEGLETDFTRRCFVTHFFNPPRYLPLLELIPGPHTDPGLIVEFRDFAQWRLGREVVICKDTPYFVGNRFFSFFQQHTVNTALAQGLSVGEVDALTGPLLGRPKTATFRLADLVGLDVMEQVSSHVKDLLPEDVALQSVTQGSVRQILQTLTEAGHFGRKSTQGFYKEVMASEDHKVYMELDLDAARQGVLQYRNPMPLEIHNLKSLMAMPLAERLQALLFSDFPYQDFIWEILGRSWSYLAGIASELANSVYAIDRVMRWGFGWELGPFEAWDSVGYLACSREMDARGMTCPQVSKTLWLGQTVPEQLEEDRRFHRGSGATRESASFDGGYVAVRLEESFHHYQDTLGQAKVLLRNDSASLKKGSDQILLLEIHSKLNTIDNHVLAVCQSALDRLHGSAAGLVITDDNDIFSAGANLQLLLQEVEAQNWAELERRIGQGQNILQALREAPKPVIAALRGLALGGGVEMIMAADRAVAYRDARLGLVESRVGLIPGWGGCKELVRRHLPVNGDWQMKSPELTVQALMLTIGQAQVSSQAEQARNMGLLGRRDMIVNRSSQVLAGAETALLSMQLEGYRPPVTKENVYAGGKDLRANLETTLYFMHEGEFLSDYDYHIGSTLALVLSGGDLDTPAWMDEQYFLDLERESILSLLGEEKTQARIRHMLSTGKPLAN